MIRRGKRLLKKSGEAGNVKKRGGEERLQREIGKEENYPVFTKLYQRADKPMRGNWTCTKEIPQGGRRGQESTE